MIEHFGFNVVDLRGVDPREAREDVWPGIGRSPREDVAIEHVEGRFDRRHELSQP